MSLRISRSSVSRVRPLLYLTVLVALVGGAPAATISVPADYATIQAAVAAAAAGDTIIVAAGTYTENLMVDKSLTIASADGAATTIITANVADTPIIKITADGVVIDGFTVDQQHPGPAGTPYIGNSAIMIDGGHVKIGGVTIQNCTLLGNSTDEGLLVNPGLEGGRLTLQGNTFGKETGAVFGFTDALHFHYTVYGPPLSSNVSAHTATIGLLGNTAAEFDRGGVYFEGDVHMSAVTLTGNEFTGTHNAAYGLYFGGNVTNLSAVDVGGSTFAEVDNGCYVSNYVDNLSTFSIGGGAATGFRHCGVYAGRVDNASALTVTACTLTGDGTQAALGLSTALENAGRAVIDGCTISGVDERGIDLAQVYYGASATITNNTIDIVDTGSSGYGICTDTEYNSDTLIRANRATGFDYCGIYESGPYAGSTALIDGNTLTASAAGADYGIYADDAELASLLTIVNNSASDFERAGIYNTYSQYGSSLTITGNTLTALAASGADYGIYQGHTTYESETVIDGNTVAGFNTYGLYLESVYYDSRFSFTGNVLAAYTDGAGYGIYAYDLYEGATATFANNEVSGFGNTAGTDYGFYNDGVYDGATLTVTDNAFAGHAAFADYGFYSNGGFQDSALGVITRNTLANFQHEGFYCDYPAYRGSRFTLTDNVFVGSGAAYGVDLPHGVDYGGEATIARNTVTGFTGYGMYIDYVDDGSSLTVADNTVTATPAASGDQYGIYFNGDVHYGSELVVSGNAISNISAPSGQSGYGVYFMNTTDGSTSQVFDNVVSGVLCDGTSHGFWFEYVVDYGALLQVYGNQISGFNDSAVYLHGDDDSGGTVEFHDNTLTGGQYGIYYDPGYNVSAGSTGEFTANVVTGFTSAGLYFGGEVWGSRFVILENRFVGDGAANGVSFDDAISSGAEVTLTGNCFQGVLTGLRVDNILDTSFLAAHQNDFSAATTGIENVSGDADHVINAQENYWASAVTSGQVDASLPLSAPPDSDADGVPNCADLCRETPAGEAVDANGCSCLQLNPTGDSDNDGVLDCLDGCPDDPQKSAPGACGCGQPDTDTDGDGVADCIDGCPDDPNKADPGACGCGVADTDLDGDGVADCIDNCPADANPDQADWDGDGIGDACEQRGLCGVGACPAAGFTLIGLTLIGLVRSRRGSLRAR